MPPGGLRISPKVFTACTYAEKGVVVIRGRGKIGYHVFELTAKYGGIGKNVFTFLFLRITFFCSL
jgi:hypothetical protein